MVRVWDKKKKKKEKKVFVRNKHLRKYSLTHSIPSRSGAVTTPAFWSWIFSFTALRPWTLWRTLWQLGQCSADRKRSGRCPFAPCTFLVCSETQVGDPLQGPSSSKIERRPASPIQAIHDTCGAIRASTQSPTTWISHQPCPISKRELCLR